MGKQYSQKELLKIARKQGWDINETRGKGSHVLLTKDGERPFPIPQKIKPGLMNTLKKRLGIKD